MRGERGGEMKIVLQCIQRFSAAELNRSDLIISVENIFKV